MKTNAPRGRAKPHASALAPSRPFGDTAVGPSSGGHDFGRVSVTAPVTGTGAIQRVGGEDALALIPHPTLGGSREEPGDSVFRERRRRASEERIKQAREKKIAEARSRQNQVIPSGPTVYADIPEKMLLEDKDSPGDFAEVDVPGHNPGFLYTDLGKSPLGSQKEFDEARRAAQIEKASGGHTSGYTSRTSTGSLFDPKTRTRTPIKRQRQVYHPGRHASTLKTSGIKARITHGAVTGDRPAPTAPSSSSRFLSFEHENRSHDAAQKAFTDALANGSLPKNGQNFHNAYHIVTDMGMPVGESVGKSGPKTTVLSSPFEHPVKSSVYSATTGPVPTQHVRTVFNIGSDGTVTRAQHFPTPPGDAPTSHHGAAKVGSSTVFATTYQKHSAPKADAANLSLAWDKPQ